VKFKSLASIRTTWYSVRMLICQASSSVRTTRTLCSDSNLCLEALNCFKLHSFECFSNMLGRPIVFDKYKDFFPKHRYGKTVANCPDVRSTPFGCYPWWGKSCRRHSTIRTSVYTVWTLRPYYGNCVEQKYDRSDDRATPSRPGLIQERIISEFEKSVAQLSVRTPSATV
jgi:hypothetical protein